MAKRRRRELIEADRFRATVEPLLRARHSDWNEWEETWLVDEAQRPPDYVYTDVEWRKQLDEAAPPFPVWLKPLLSSQK